MSWNPIKLLSQLVGAHNLKKVCCCLFIVGLLVLLVFCIPNITSIIVSKSISKVIGM